MSRVAWGAISICILISLGCGRFFKGPGVGQSVTVAKVETRRTSPEITVNATLIPSDRVTVTFPQLVRIKRMLAGVGKTVIKGDPLVELDDTDVRTRVRQLSAELQEAKTLLDKNKFLLDNRDKLRAEEKLTELQAEGLVKEVAANEATIVRLEADNAVLEQSLVATTIASPIAGVVIDRPANPGQEIAANQPLCEIININPILASFRLSADEAGGIAVGDTVKVRVDELQGETFDASVTFVGPELHAPDNTFTIWASIPNPLEVLKSGMRAFTEFRSSKVHDVHVVPTSALVMRQNRPHLFVIKDGIAKLIRPQIKSINKNDAVLISGVATDQYVVVKGQESLEDGMVVDMR